MEPDVIRIYSSSPPPMEDATEDEDNEVGDFGDFGGFSGVPNSISFTEFDTPTTFNQTQALSATSPPELLAGGGGRTVTGFSHGSSNGALGPGNDLPKANGVAPSERTEMKKALSGSLELSASEPADCNGGGSEVLTNGFATFDLQGSPSSQNSVHSHVKGTSTEDTGSVPAGSSEDDFADFAAFSNVEGQPGQTAGWDQDSDGPSGPAEDPRTAQVTPSEDGVRDTKRSGPHTDSSPGPAEAPDGSCNTDRGPQAAPDSQRDVAFAQEHLASEAVCTTDAVALNGADGADSKDAAAGCSDGDLSPGDGEAGRADGKGSGNDTETETETETSLGRPLSTDALEEYGDVSTTGSAPSPPLQGETATPGELSQLAEDDEDFGDFGDAGSFGGQGFADFDQLDVPPERSAPPQETPPAKDDDDDFGDFNSPKFHGGGTDGDAGDGFADFPVSDSFGNFSSAAAGGADGGADAGWSAFGEPEQQGEGESWAAFSTEQSAAPPAERREEEGEEEPEEEEEEEEEEWHESEPVSDEASRTDRQTASLSSRLEKLFQSSFPQAAAPPVKDQVSSLKVLLGPPTEKPDPGAEEAERPPSRRSLRGGVWMQLQDIHEALGLRYQWGGSHCNKALLCCLGIDTRNILFTGQKKQPVIVPMYAASLGMLEPTKEPVKPVSAAEMIASIAQAPPAAPEKNSCPPDSAQEALPPVQFDWSSSGLTNPLDASGGSSLLNLDFFGPVEDSGSSSSPSIPGVDPELFELTTAKMDAGGSGSRVADAFARLMSTMEKTSTSTRKPTKKEENLSEEASKVIAALPDLSFMQAKVLMFPATLTPLGCQATPD